MTTTLCIDTCGPALHLALADGDDVVTTVHEEMRAGQAERIVPAICELMGSGARLDRVAVTVGPGSFTGVRIGVSVAKALALAYGCAVVPLNRLATLAHCSRRTAPEQPLAVVLDARRKEVFAQAFGPDAGGVRTELSGPMVLAVDAVEDWIASLSFTLAGYNQRSAAIAREDQVLPEDPKAFARAALSQALRTPGVAHGALKPMYLRAPDAKLPTRVGLSIA